MPLFFDLTHSRSLGQKSKNNFVCFLGQMRTWKFASEIYWPIVWAYSTMYVPSSGIGSEDKTSSNVSIATFESSWTLLESWTNSISAILQVLKSK